MLFVIRHTEVNNPENLCRNIEMPLIENYEKKSKKFLDNLPENIENFSSPSKKVPIYLNVRISNFLKEQS